MRVQIREGGVKVSKVLRAHVEQTVSLALGRYSDRIDKVMVHFADHGGETCCRVAVGLKARKIEVEGVEDDRFAAVIHAAERASKSVDRALDRELWSEDGPRPVPSGRAQASKRAR
jgi:ribosome-associated translation inhibitor RaiA